MPAERVRSRAIPTIGQSMVRRLELIGELDPQERAALLDMPGRIENVARGHEIFKLGERPTESVIVLSGLVRRYSIDVTGALQIHAFFIATDMPTLESLELEVMDHTLGTVTSSVVGFIPHSELRRVGEQHSRLTSLFWRETLIHGAVLREWLLRNSAKESVAQMAHLFCEMMTRYRAVGLARGNVCDFPVVQEHLAEALGISLVHVSRTMSALRLTGAVDFKDGVLTIYDERKLADLGGFDPFYLHLQHTPAQPASQH